MLCARKEMQSWGRPSAITCMCMRFGATYEERSAERQVLATPDCLLWLERARTDLDHLLLFLLANGAQQTRAVAAYRLLFVRHGERRVRCVEVAPLSLAH
jgi:hypothetical protein